MCVTHDTYKNFLFLVAALFCFRKSKLHIDSIFDETTMAINVGKDKANFVEPFAWHKYTTIITY